MSKKIFYTLFLCTIFFNTNLHAAFWSTKQPPETLVLQLPENKRGQWKEISRSISKEGALVERIPLNQIAKNWSEMIAIEFYPISTITKDKSIDLDTIIDCFKEEVMSGYPIKKVTWNLIEKNASEVIYEWVLYSPYQNIAPQQEIAKLVVTDAGMHRIGVTQKVKKMTSEERAEWLALLQNSTSIMNMEDAKKATHALSTAKP